MLIIRLESSEALSLQKLLNEHGLHLEIRERKSRDIGEVARVTEFLVKHVDSGILLLLYLCLKALRVKFSVQVRETIFSYDGIPFPSIVEFFKKIAPKVGLPSEPPKEFLVPESEGRASEDASSSGLKTRRTASKVNKKSRHTEKGKTS